MGQSEWSAVVYTTCIVLAFGLLMHYDWKHPETEQRPAPAEAARTGRGLAQRAADVAVVGVSVAYLAVAALLVWAWLHTG